MILTYHHQHRAVSLYGQGPPTLFRLFNFSDHCVAVGGLRQPLTVINLVDFANPWNDIGAYFIELDRPDEALFFLKRAVRMRSYALRCYPHYNLHRAYLALGDRERAVTHLHEALDADPDFGPALAALSDLLFPGGPAERLDDEMDDCLRAGTPVLALPPR